MKGSDHLKEISYGYQERVRRNRSIQYERWDFLPPAVESLTVRDMDEQGYWCRQDIKARDAGNFCYAVDNKNAHAVWSMNREFRLSGILKSEWDTTARRHTSRGLTTEVRWTNFVPGDVVEALSPAREAAALFSERSYATDPSQKQMFKISYEHRFEYRQEYEIWGGDIFHRREEDDNYPWSGDESEEN
ncbi:hypothetical protein CCHR01_03840 [Colletotrichum chrysophilum]|uniref:Uncharacterized protein n=1 Tax=Colletotrichum chrysophilum TaxID=1836956 RepID=A0AAD9AS36_9PEZI|nr:hypothetical protein CCHR01_03840 [Colletotrichum chrysophilum]